MKKIHKTCHLKLVLDPFVLQRIKHNLYWKMKLLKQATYIVHVLAKLLKFVQISTQTYSYSFLQQIL